MSKYDELKRLAEDMKGWPNKDAFESDDAWCVGSIDEDDNLWPVIEVQTERYDAFDASEPMATYYAAANPAAILELIAENERLQADKNTVDCRFEVSRDTLEVIRGCLRQAESEIDQMKAQSVERGAVSRALHEAVSAIYFDDSSDFGSALWAVVRHLAPELIEELESDPSAVWHKTEALAEQESSK